MFSVLLHSEAEAVGTIGHWERVWRGDVVYETGWSVFPRFQGRGIAAAAALAAAERAAVEHKHRYLHAFPSVDHPASNAVCRKAGFSFIAECDFEFPPDNIIRSNDWRLDLTVMP
jgi:RimJ/RimL family protein N-acetyltransferase